MLARRLPTILPVMSQQESLETTKIYVSDQDLTSGVWRPLIACGG